MLAQKTITWPFTVVYPNQWARLNCPRWKNPPIYHYPVCPGTVDSASQPARRLKTSITETKFCWIWVQLLSPRHRVYRPTTRPTPPTFQLPKTAYLLPPRLPGPPPVRWEETRNGSGPNHQKATAHYRIGADCDRRRHRFGCLYARRNRHGPRH